MKTLVLHFPDPAATQEFGRRLGRLIFSGAVVGLTGQLGAGKTFLVRAVAEGLGVPDSRVVGSPTFVLIQEYQGRLPLYHFDTYRLKTPTEFADLGVHEYFEDRGVCMIEWAERVAELLPKERLDIRLEVTGDTARRAVLEAHGPAYERLLDQLAE
ncbi:MAG: tRNA (adenosine(37)-N6)-threonylcarbamoyltransferase complex ATPase subunit type 1 TsaE [Gemmatales bacterium]|nr:tRNA (adenosine(37)-N6)-threonylcarbamoyltransferase complex ATPase subunit type 1 TsaE [Gemmatales bacterium]MDW8386645.1 tRNA (adenosine(37)-N6)-threonylcarbamoyltransferase complex ATPase subunit type 1 TsaE [Gemmatales bacterium]